ncbi:MAG TPA: penicillin-binding protein, partial [Allosphingosinicella sp.]
GTTSSEKDGYFVGFSSGLTTGVWIGRDDNKRIPGLAGGRNPASAFRDFMSAAVANRPVEQFQTEVATPEWQLEEGVEPFPGAEGMMVDPEGGALTPGDPGLPVEDQPSSPGALPPRQEEGNPDRLDDAWIDRAINRRPAPTRTPPPPRQPPPRAEPEPEPEPELEEDY